MILAVVAISAISGKNKNTASSTESTPVVTESAASQAESVTQEPGAAEESTESAAQEQSAVVESSDADSTEEAAESTADGSSTASESSPAGSANAGEANGGSQNKPAYTYDEDNDSAGAENYLYTVQYNNTEVRLDRYFGPEDETMVIPEIIDGLPVTSIGEKCFEDHTYIKKLVLPETLEAIYYRAFYGCSNLVEMNIPASLTHVGGWSFAHCGFVNVIFPDTFDALDYGAFYGCNNLETVVLPAAVDWFGENTFRMCPKLISVTMPAENPEINAKAFEPDTDVTIIGIPGSYTEKYAKGMGLKFEAYTGG